MQRRAAPLDELLAVIRSRIHQRTQLLLRLGEREPRLLHADAERARKEREGESAAAVLDHLLGVLVARQRRKRRLKVGQGAVFLIEVVVGIAHAEVPDVIVGGILCVRREEVNRLLEIPPLARLRNVVVGARQLAVELGRALCGGDLLYRRNDLLVISVIVPCLTLFQ